MSKRKLICFFSIILGIVLTVCAVFSTSAYSDSDPLISLSYLQEIFAPAFKQEIVSELSNSNDADVTDDSNAVTPDDTESTEADVPKESNSYTLIELTSGQTVMANSICEFIVRPGSHVAVISPFPSQGVADITNGIEVLADQETSINAYCIIPRGGDGRGLKVTGEKAYIMIRGDYTIG